MITIFGTPKNFEGIFKIIQINAIRSWRSLSKDVEIIIFGKSEGAQKIANEVSAIYYPNIKCSKNGVPLLSDLFYKANKIPDLILLDLMMPKMNGFEFLELYRRDFKKQAPVVVITGADLDEKDKKFLSSETTRVLEKSSMTDIGIADQLVQTIASVARGN